MRKPSLESKTATALPSPAPQPPPQQQQHQPLQQKEDVTRAQKFLDSMARRSTEVPTDFLNTIEEERTKSPEVRINGTDSNPTMGKILAKKYPFNRYGKREGGFFKEI